MSKEPFKVDMGFNDILKKISLYKPKDKEKPIILSNGIKPNKNENNNKKDLTAKEENL